MSLLSQILPIFLFILSINYSCQQAATGFNDEYKLYGDLFKSYSRNIRPVRNWKDVLPIDIRIALIKIADVIEDYQTILIHARLEMSWNDQYLTWNQTNYNNLPSIIVPASNVWLPDLHLFNSANDDDRLVPVNVQLSSDGTINTFPLTYLNAHCDFDFSRFPYDTQTCSFIIGTVIDQSKVNLKLRSKNIEGKNLFPNPEWKFVSSSIDNDTIKFPDMNEWSTVSYTVKIKRSSTFYVNLFIWPLIFILFLTMSIFIMPPTCVERISLGVLLLLTLVVNLLMLESYTPKNSFNSWPIIGKLIMFNMFMVTISTVVATIVVGINRDNFIVRTIPTWLKNMTLGWMGKVACKVETAHAILSPGHRPRDEEIEVIDTNQITQQQNEQNSINGVNSTTTTTSNETSQSQILLVLINNQLAMLRMRLQEKDLKEQNKKEWFLVASVIDRVCLVAYLLIMLLGLAIVFS